MDISMLINMLDAIKDICGTTGKDLGPVFGIIGYVIIGIKIVVPILLIVFGMIQMATAVMANDDKKIKEAQKGLISKIIAAVAVFLIITLVTFLMNVIGDESWKECADCLNNPNQTKCKIKDSVPTS